MRPLVFLLAGCWSTSPATPVVPVSSPGVIIDAPTGAPMARPPRHTKIPRHSVWEGTYVCNQGLSAVKLTLDVDRANKVTARYDFGPVPSNPTVPVGAYLLTGELVSEGGNGFSGELADSEWITRPTGYFMVPVRIETSDGKSMSGAILHPTCSSFQATRIE